MYPPNKPHVFADRTKMITLETSVHRPRAHAKTFADTEFCALLRHDLPDQVAVAISKDQWPDAHTDQSIIGKASSPSSHFQDSKIPIIK